MRTPIHNVADLVADVRSYFGEAVQTVTRKDLVKMSAAKSNKKKIDYAQFLGKPKYVVSRGVYAIDLMVPASNKAKSKTVQNKPTQAVPVMDMSLTAIDTHPGFKRRDMFNGEVLAPTKNDGYVTFGIYDQLHTIVAANCFFPVMITGHTGNGKTTAVEEVCARLKKPLVKITCNEETNEFDLLGGHRIIEGTTHFEYGPVVRAMQAGAVLLMDELDKASADKVMSLQTVLEGKPLFIKKINESIYPAPGFTVIATMNTKGRGSFDGKYITAKILDESFLERFIVTLEQEYPDESIEKRILVNRLNKTTGEKNIEFASTLAAWSAMIRKLFATGQIDDIITTRRLIHIVDTYSIFKSKLQSINMGIARFDDVVKTSFLDLYANLDLEIAEELAKNNPSKYSSMIQKTEVTTNITTPVYTPVANPVNTPVTNQSTSNASNTIIGNVRVTTDRTVDDFNDIVNAEVSKLLNAPVGTSTFQDGVSIYNESNASVYTFSSAYNVWVRKS